MSGGRTHLVHSGDSVNNTAPDDGNERTKTPPEDGGFWDGGVKQHVKEEANAPSSQDSAQHLQSNKMRGSRGFLFRRNDIPSVSSTALMEEFISLPQTVLGVPLPVPHSPLGNIVPSPSTHDPPSRITNSPTSNTHGPAQAAAKTSTPSCTPSPTESLPPSASA